MIDFWNQREVIKEVNTVSTPVVPGKYTVLAIKLVSALLQNVLEKILGYTSLFRLYRPILIVPTSIGVSIDTIKKIKKNLLKFFYLI